MSNYSFKDKYPIIQLRTGSKHICWCLYHAHTLGSSHLPMQKVLQICCWSDGAYQVATAAYWLEITTNDQLKTFVCKGENGKFCLNLISCWSLKSACTVFLQHLYRQLQKDRGFEVESTNKSVEGMSSVISWKYLVDCKQNISDIV